MCQSDRCYIVPQYLLRSIVESSHEEVTAEVREHAEWTLREGLVDLRAKRAEIFAALTVPRGFHAQHQQAIPHRQSIVPDVLFQQIADSDEVDEDTRDRARSELEHIRSKIAEFQAVQEGSSAASAQKSTLHHTAAAEGDEKQDKVAKFYRAIYDAQKNPRESKLPGKSVRLEGQKPTGDVAADAAYDNGGLVLQFYKDKFNWHSIDNKNMHVVSSVHFGINYENACKFSIMAQRGLAGIHRGSMLGNYLLTMVLVQTGTPARCRWSTATETSSCTSSLNVLTSSDTK